MWIRIKLLLVWLSGHTDSFKMRIGTVNWYDLLGSLRVLKNPASEFSRAICRSETKTVFNILGIKNLFIHLCLDLHKVPHYCLNNKKKSQQKWCASNPILLLQKVWKNKSYTCNNWWKPYYFLNSHKTIIRLFSIFSTWDYFLIGSTECEYVMVEVNNFKAATFLKKFGQEAEIRSWNISTVCQ